MYSTRRHLIAVDAQNLLGCHPANASAACWEFAIVESLRAVGFREDTDHLVIAVAPDWAFTVKALAPSARLMVRGGRHGADLALCSALEDASFIASRYSEVVIASGSHILRSSVRALADAGVSTTVACLPLQTSSELTAAAAHVTWLDRPRRVLGAAAIVAAASATRETYALAPVDANPRTVPLRTRLGLAA
ncbi:hypothetical protein [Demequina lutea]|uniref:NYN domain-containing protein n=1 Tax=Demequina lutea TaxID=431489 RepID=A0A7Y9ZD21_9MICO|nr:hypothetical protein [Demequina lutea]NYI42635.1 hypothetical protein [Demequina lutea]